MTLLGRWNCYLPSWLEWLPHLSIEGTPQVGPAAPSGRAVGAADERAARRRGADREGPRRMTSINSARRERRG